MTKWIPLCRECMERPGTIRLNDWDIWPGGGYMCRECWDEAEIK